MIFLVIDILKLIPSHPEPIYAAIAPVVVAAIISAAAGLAQAGIGASAKKKANAVKASAESPEQRNLLNELERKRKQIASGGTEYQLGADVLSKGLATTQANVLKTGGSSGSTLQGLTMTGSAYGDALNKTIAQNQQIEGYYTNLAGQIIGDIQNTKLGLALAEKAKGEARSAQLTKAGGQNLMGGATQLGNSPEGMSWLSNLFGKKASPTTSFASGDSGKTDLINTGKI